MTKRNNCRIVEKMKIKNGQEYKEKNNKKKRSEVNWNN